MNVPSTPNVVLVVIDALRADRLDATLNGIPVVPYLSNMALHSVRFTNAITACSWTRPSMASIFTGIPCEAHEVSTAKSVLSPEIETMAAYLRHYGYSTMAVQTIGNMAPKFGVEQGFDEYDFHGFPEISSEQVTEYALQQVQKHSAPFFLYVHYMAPHVPYFPPEQYRTLFGYPPAELNADERSIAEDFVPYTLDQVYNTLGFKSARQYPELSSTGNEAVRMLYDGEARYADTEVGRLLDTLLDANRYPNTIVIVLADHGEHFGEHGQLGHGLSLYEPLVRVPLLLKAPALSPAVIDATVSTIDILPTVAALLGLPARLNWQGQNLLTPREPLTPAFSDTHIILSSVDYWLESVREGSLKLIRNQNTGNVELYDISADPAEATDLAETSPEKVAHLQGLLDAQYERNVRARARPQAATNASDRDDISVLRERIVQPFLEVDIDVERCKRLMEALTTDGRWADIDYTDTTKNGWKTARHLSNVAVLTCAYTSPKSPLRHAPEAKRAVCAGLDYWLSHDFRNPNWWHNDIGVPQTLGPILLLLGDELNAEQRAKGIEILKRGKLGMAGQNLVWLAEITLVRGILERDANLIGNAFARVADEITVSPEEGIQADFSFHQHGACLYNHGYGADFAVDCARIAGLASGTRFAFPVSKTELLTRYVLDGSQWMAYGAAEDYGADGREIVRAKQTADYLSKAAANLLRLSTGRETELTALKARTARREAAPLEGNRHFWRSDFMTHLRGGFYTSARMYSTRVDNTDDPHNGESIKSHYIADGCNFLLVSGHEYEDIFPVWNWEQIPGTTVEQSGEFAGPVRRKGTTDFVGGVSDGRYGLAAFDFVRDTLRARKSWFFFDRGYVCLGAGITCDSEHPVFTTLNQCFLRGDVVIADGTIGRLETGEHCLQSPVEIRHDGVAYIVSSSGELVLRNMSQYGSWRAISQSLSADPISRDVFTLCVDHGKTPRNATYAYAVYPGIDMNRPEPWANDLNVEILNNTTGLQAVTCAAIKLTEMAFFEAGSLAIDDKTTVEVDNPCLLMMQETDRTLHVAVSDPSQKLKTINMKVSKPLIGDQAAYDPATGKSTVMFSLPTGQYAGQGVVRDFELVR